MFCLAIELLKNSSKDKAPIRLVDSLIHLGGEDRSKRRQKDDL
nr:MAG TPA: hypothetical protein [Caudoviricetes sp.]